jgi:hypothetical protein
MLLRRVGGFALLLLNCAPVDAKVQGLEFRTRSSQRNKQPYSK